MKSLRILLALAFAGILAVSVAQAGGDKGECKDKAAKCCGSKDCTDGKCCKDKKAECKDKKSECKDSKAECTRDDAKKS